MLLPFVTAQHPTPPIRELSIALEPIASPAGAGTAEPAMTTERGRTILSWLELAGKQASLKFAERTASGWSEVRTAAAGESIMVNSSDVPSVFRLGSDSLVAQWLQRDGPDPESYTLQLSWSGD